MGNITLLIGIGIFAIICIYMFFKLGEQQKETKQSHFILQLLILFFVLISLVLVGKVGLDDSNHCEFVNSNSTIVGNVTTNDYVYLCETNINSTSNIFYKTTLWFMRLILIYMFIYFTYEVLIYFGVVIPKQ